MHVISQIIERNLHRRDVCESACWINPEPDGCWLIASEKCNELKLYTQDSGASHTLEQAGATVEFVAFPRSDNKKYRWVIINLPRQKALLQMMLHCAADLLAEDGVLWLAGENKAGVKSAGKHLKEYFGKVEKLDNARHCGLFEASAVLRPDSFDAKNYQQAWDLSRNDTRLSIISYPGVFAHGRLDAGSALLLDALADLKPEGDVLDFACGAGIIGASIAARHVHTNITFLDNSALALKSTEETLRANHLSGTILASDGLSKLQGSFDLIVSNPPIHAGIRTDSQLGMRLLDSVDEHINPGGRLLIVANVHLPYERWLSQRFDFCSELLSNQHFKIIVANKRAD